MSLFGQFSSILKKIALSRQDLINQTLAEMLVNLLVQGGACVAAAAPDNHNVTLSNIERIIRVVKILPSTSLRWITGQNK